MATGSDKTWGVFLQKLHESDASLADIAESTDAVLLGILEDFSFTNLQKGQILTRFKAEGLLLLLPCCEDLHCQRDLAYALFIWHCKLHFCEFYLIIFHYFLYFPLFSKKFSFNKKHWFWQRRRASQPLSPPPLPLRLLISLLLPLKLLLPPLGLPESRILR